MKPSLLLSQFELRRYAIVGPNGLFMVPMDGLVHGHFGVNLNRFRDGFEIRHIPTGLAISRHFFSNIDPATAAVLELEALRNNWVDVDAEILAPLKGRIDEIMLRHGAAPILGAGIASEKQRGKRTNGFEGWE
ncbi:MAG: hypothetical protein H6Q99_301 [Proteobacteria bacterium]|nr:hypothetical protein [Pseudomonadota bacterium]